MITSYVKVALITFICIYIYIVLNFSKYLLFQFFINPDQKNRLKACISMFKTFDFFFEDLKIINKICLEALHIKFF